MMKLSIMRSAAVLAGVLTVAPGTVRAQQVSVDASVRLNDDLIVGVSYGRAYVRDRYVYYPDGYRYHDYHYHRHPGGHARVHRTLDRRHRGWHRDVAREHAHLHRDLARGRAGPYEHARWHRAVAREHDRAHHDLEHKHRKEHRKGRKRGH